MTEASALEWIDGEHHLAVDNALFEVLRVRGFERLSQEFTLAFARRPLIAPILSRARRLSRGHPEGLLKRVPLVWPLVFRGFGQFELELELERARGSGTLEFVDPREGAP